ILLLATACGDDDSAGRGTRFLDAITSTTASQTDPSDPADQDDADDTDPGSGGSVSWTREGSLEFATLEVPLDYDDPSAGTIELAVARRPARDPDRRIGPLLMNPGGPGASGVELVGLIGFLLPS